MTKLEILIDSTDGSISNNIEGVERQLKSETNKLGPNGQRRFTKRSVLSFLQWSLCRSPS